jgi:hypothetical protein
MITVVEKLLSERFEGKARLDAAEEVRSGGRSKVSRYHVLEGPQCAPKSVIVKQAVAAAGVASVRNFLEDDRRFRPSEIGRGDGADDCGETSRPMASRGGCDAVLSCFPYPGLNSRRR